MGYWIDGIMGTLLITQVLCNMHEL